MTRKSIIFIFLMMVLTVQGEGFFPGGGVHAAGDFRGQDKNRFCPVGQRSFRMIILSR